MKRILVAIGIYCLSLNSAHAQFKLFPAVSDSTVGFRSLKIDEINIVSSYYEQNGNNSAITGGVGTEYLYDIAASIDLKVSFRDKKFRTHNLNVDVSRDYYSSASSDNIDPRTVSGASRSDIHIYPSASWSRKDEKRHETVGAGISYSTEWDYTSYGGNLSYSKATQDNNTELTLKAGLFLDSYEVILPAELRSIGSDQDSFKPRNTYVASLGISQVISQRLQLMFIVEPTYQEGLLSTPFHRVYFNDGTEEVEKLPGKRFKIPASIRGSYFLGDRIILRSFYRYYADNWGMQAHTASIEIPVKINSFFSVTPHYRFNSQSAVDYFAPFKERLINEVYYTSDYDLSAFNSSFFGAGVRIAPPGGIFGTRFWNSLEIRYGHYTRTTGMVANIISLTTKFK